MGRSSAAETRPFALAAATAALAGAVLAAIAAGGIDEPAIRMALRATARLSFVLFTAAFVAPAAHQLWPGRGAAWLLGHRPGLALSFAVSHAYHALAIVALAVLAGVPFGAATLALGGFGYAMVAVTAAASLDSAAARLGRARRERILGAAGWFLWAVFALNFVALAGRSSMYLPFAALALATPLLRVAAWRKRRAALGGA